MTAIEEHPAADWPATLNHTALFASVCAPQRPAFDRADAALRGVRAPREALEIAAAQGLCPVDWLTSDARAFGGAPHSPRLTPHSVDAVLALVSDAAGVLRAEALAREFVARAARFGAALPPPSRAIYWRPRSSAKLARGARVEARWHVPIAVMRATFRSMHSAAIARAVATIPGVEERPIAARRGLLSRLLERLGLGADPLRFATGPYTHRAFAQWNAISLEARSTAARQALEDHRLAWEYSLAARAGLTLRDALQASPLGAVDDATLDLSLASTPNPFAPLAELWWSGYALYAADERKVELVLPLPERDVAR